MQFNENIPKPQNLVFYPTFLKKPALILPKDDPSSNILSPLKSNPSELSPIRKPLKEISVKVPLSSSHRNQGSQIQSHLLDTTHEIQVITESHQICNELDLSVPSESSTQANESLINDNHLLIEKLNVQISDLKMELDKVKQSANQFQQQTSSLDKLLRDRDLQIRELIEENKTLASQVQGNQVKYIFYLLWSFVFLCTTLTSFT
jgi:chromosome segregation ATPase